MTIESNGPVDLNHFLNSPDKHERITTLALPLFMAYIRSKFTERTEAVLAFNNVGLRRNFDNAYDDGTKQIENIEEYLNKKFNVPNYEIWRDDSKEFFEFLTNKIPELLKNETLEIKEKDIYKCKKCENIIGIRGNIELNECNNCGSNSSVIKKENVLILNLSDKSNIKNLYNSLDNLNKKYKDRIKSEGFNNKKEILVSKTNRGNGFSLGNINKILEGQYLDPLFALAFETYHISKGEKTNINLYTGLVNYLHKYILEIGDESYNNINFIRHSKIPKGILLSGEYDNEFLQYLILNTIKIPNDLKPNDIKKLFKDFTNKKKFLKQIYISNNLPGKKVNKTNSGIIYDERLNPKELLTIIDDFSKKINYNPLIDKPSNDYSEQIVKVLDGVYGIKETKIYEVDKEVDKIKLFIIEKIQYYKLTKKTSIIHIGSSIDKSKYKPGKSDIDLDFLIKNYNIEDYKNLKQIFVDLKKNFKTKIDCHVREGEILNKYGYSYLKEDSKSDIIWNDIKVSKNYNKIFGKDFLENYFTNIKGGINFNKYEFLFKNYKKRVLISYLYETKEINIQKYLPRVLLTFINSLKDESEIIGQNQLNNIEKIEEFEKLIINNSKLNHLKNIFNEAKVLYTELYIENNFNKNKLDELNLIFISILDELNNFIVDKYENYGEDENFNIITFSN